MIKSVEIEFDEADFKKLGKMLNPKETNKIARSAVNAAGAYMKKRIKLEVTKKYTIKKARYNKALRKPIRASARRLNYILYFFGNPIGLYDNYKVRSVRKGVSVQVQKKRKVKLKHAFIARNAANNKMSVFERDIKAEKRYASAGRYRGTKIKRQPLNRLTGPSVKSLVKQVYTKRLKLRISKKFEYLFKEKHEEYLAKKSVAKK